MRLLLASAFTLGLLSTFLGSILLAFLFYFDVVSGPLLFGLVILLNLVIWLVGPWISDWMYAFFYDMQWYTLDEMYDFAPDIAAFVEEQAEEHGFAVPKLGIIDDGNPNAFTYGSGRWNGRVVATRGLFEVLDTNELKAVYAHEFGHIQHRDFIVMTIANTLVELLYEAHVVMRETLEHSNRGKGKAPIVGLMVVSYLFYWVGQYVLLYLSRVREYYADQFSARQTHPNHLSSALIKVSYGILLAEDDKRLIQSTKHMGIQNFDQSEDIGLVYYNCEDSGTWDALHRVLMFDLVNPWARISELRSDHPLTGKRIRRLCSLTDQPMFDFDRIRRSVAVDKNRLYKGFLKDIGVIALPTVSMLGWPLLFAAAVYRGMLPVDIPLFAGGWIAAFGLGLAAKTVYKYPGGEPEEATVLELMGDLYASPVRGRPVRIQGELIGKGEAGFMFSEDLVLRDRTGMMFLNYQSWLPVIGNLIFAVSTVEDLLHTEAEAEGWFLRDVMPWIGLKKLRTAEKNVTGFVKYGSLIGAGLLVAIGLAIVLYF